MFPSSTVVYPLGAPYFPTVYNGSVGEAPHLVDTFTQWGSTGGLVIALMYVCSLCYIIAEYFETRKEETRPSIVGQKSATLEQHLLAKREGAQTSAALLPASLKAGSQPCSLATLKEVHGVKHIAVIMDGNRRFGKLKTSASASVSSPPKRKGQQQQQQQQQPASPSNGVPSSASAFPASKAESFVTRSRVYRNALTLLRSVGMGEKVIGHRAGGEKLLEFAKYCINFNIPILTVYAFSTENWSRPQEEIDILMALFAFFFEQMREEAHKHGIHCRFIVSDASRLNPEILALMRDIEKDTRRIKHRRITVNVCVSYGSRLEIANACQSLAAEGKTITEEAISSKLLTSLTELEDTEYLADAEEQKYLAFMRAHDPDVLFRTSGESRISNFLLYQCAYSEMIFSSKAWPAIEAEDLEAVLVEYCCRNRRFGK